jgi:hypothetical protein
MRYLRHVRAAIVACAKRDRSLGEVHARACKRLGETDPVGVRLMLCSLVSGKISRDGRSLPTRRARRCHARPQSGGAR